MTINDICVVVGNIVVGSILGLTALVALYAASSFAYRVYREAVGWPIILVAVKEFRKNHPERFKK